MSCVRTPDSYPAPDQHRPFRANELSEFEFLSVESPRFRDAVIKDVAIDAVGAWRWTGSDPELSFTLTSNRNRTLIVEFVVHDRTFRDTGPVSISYYVNGHLAGRERYTTNGDKSFEKAIPSEWLEERAETRVRLQIHNPWHSPDGQKLGVLLKRAGFVE